MRGFVRSTLDKMWSNLSATSEELIECGVGGWVGGSALQVVMALVSANSMREKILFVDIIVVKAGPRLSTKGNLLFEPTVQVPLLESVLGLQVSADIFALLHHAFHESLLVLITSYIW